MCSDDVVISPFKVNLRSAGGPSCFFHFAKHVWWLCKMKYMHHVRSASLTDTVYPREAHCWTNRKAFILTTCCEPFSKAESTHSNGYITHLKEWRMEWSSPDLLGKDSVRVFHYYAYNPASNSKIIDVCILFTNLEWNKCNKITKSEVCELL